MPWKVRVETPLKPTEDEAKVLGLVNEVLEADRVFVEERGSEKWVVATARCVSSLSKLWQMLRRERILDAARKRMLAGIRGNRLVFMLHKQALAVKRLSFVDDERESPLGPVIVEVLHDDPKEVVDWLAPPTSAGKPLWERGPPSKDCAEE